MQKQDYRIRGLEAGTSDTMLQGIKDSCGRTKSQVNARGSLLSAKRFESDPFFPSLQTWGFARPSPRCPVQPPLARRQHTFVDGLAPSSKANGQLGLVGMRCCCLKPLGWQKSLVCVCFIWSDTWTGKSPSSRNSTSASGPSTRHTTWATNCNNKDIQGHG